MVPNTLIQALQNPALYQHPVRYFKVMETHISWVILTGDYAYKIKKPVDFQFLDFSTLEKRHFYCHQELQLNQALAPEIYQAVLDIRGSLDQPFFNGSGEIIEYAIKMREFPQEMLFDKLLARDELSSRLIEKTARIMADFHEKASRDVPQARLGTPEQIHEPVMQNFAQIRPLLSIKAELDQIERLEQWACQQHQLLRDVFQARKDQGFIRACHGDIHLGNIALLQERPVIFDCIDFNDEFRWTDTMADLAFLAMDLEDKKRPDYAHLAINAYLEQSGDYQGLAVLRYYQCYRAVVRAKVTLFGVLQAGLSSEQQEKIREQYRRIIVLAEHYTKAGMPAVMIAHGVTGTGKSTVAQSLVTYLGAIRVRSDVERKRLQGLTIADRSDSELNQQIYSPKATQETYQHLAQVAEWIVQAHYPVVVDATFLQKAQRDTFEQLASRLQIPFLIIECQASDATLQARVQRRKTTERDPSEATLQVLHMQQETLEPLTTQEQAQSISFNTDQQFDVQTFCQNVLTKVHGK